MRSRYSAYVLDLRDYLLQTWDPRTRPPSIEPPTPGLRWLGLQVLEHVALTDGRATVRFVARYRLGGGSAVRMKEISRFRLDHGRWLYVDGDHG